MIAVSDQQLNLSISRMPARIHLLATGAEPDRMNAGI